MKTRKSYIVLDFLTAACLIGARVIRTYAARRIGFVRWLNFNGERLREAVPLDVLKYAALGVVLLLAAAALIIAFRKRQSLRANDYAALAAMLAVDAYYAYASFNIVYEVTKASFLIVPLTALAALFITVRCLAGPCGD